MISDEELRRLITDSAENVACRELRDALVQNSATPLRGGRGALSVHDALTTFEIRAVTTREGGLDTCGFEPTLERLRSLPPDDTLRLFTFDDQVRLFTVFVWEQQATLVGCIRVVRGKKPPSLRDQGLA